MRSKSVQINQYKSTQKLFFFFKVAFWLSETIEWSLDIKLVSQLWRVISPGDSVHSNVWTLLRYFYKDRSANIHSQCWKERLKISKPAKFMQGDALKASEDIFPQSREILQRVCMVRGTNLLPIIQRSVKLGDSALVFNKSRSNTLDTLLRFEGVFFSHVDGFSRSGPSQRLHVTDISRLYSWTTRVKGTIYGK